MYISRTRWLVARHLLSMIIKYEISSSSLLRSRREVESLPTFVVPKGSLHLCYPFVQVEREINPSLYNQVELRKEGRDQRFSKRYWYTRRNSVKNKDLETEETKTFYRESLSRGDQ